MAMDDDDNPFRGIPCRECGNAALRLEWRFKVPGPFSLSGNQIKLSVVPWPWCVCDHCGTECEGKP